MNLKCPRCGEDEVGESPRIDDGSPYFLVCGTSYYPQAGEYFTENCATELYEYHEPGDDGEDLCIRKTREEVLTFVKAEYDKRNLPYPSEEDMISDFCAVHWATKVENK